MACDMLKLNWHATPEETAVGNPLHPAPARTDALPGRLAAPAAHLGNRARRRRTCAHTARTSAGVYARRPGQDRASPALPGRLPFARRRGAPLRSRRGRHVPRPRPARRLPDSESALVRAGARVVRPHPRSAAHRSSPPGPRAGRAPGSARKKSRRSACACRVASRRMGSRSTSTRICRSFSTSSPADWRPPE